MSLAQKFMTLLVLTPVVFFLSSCGSSDTQTTSGTTSGVSGGSGSGGSGSGSSNAVPGYGEGIGASGQTGTS